MKFTQEGEWAISTPLLAGFGEAVLLAQKCTHPSWVEETKAIEQGNLLVMERCSECLVATRVKYRPATEAERGIRREDRLDAALTQAMEILSEVVDSGECPISIRCNAAELLRRWQRGEFLKPSDGSHPNG